MPILAKTAVQTDVTSVGTSFSASKLHSHVLTDIPALSSGFAGERCIRLEGIHVAVKSISSATTLTILLSIDPEGDQQLVPATTATISTGVTTTSKGCVAIKCDIPLFTLYTTNTIYIFFKTDAGTVTVDASCISYSEI